MLGSLRRRILHCVAGLSALLLLCSAGSTTMIFYASQRASAAAQSASSRGSWTAYVASGDNTVTPIDVSTNKPGTPISVGSTPGAIAITPNGSRAYVITNGGSAVTPIDTATNTAGTPIRIGTTVSSQSAGANGIAVTPNGSTMYVVNEGSPFNPGNTVSAINTSTDTVVSTISVGSLPRGVAITPNGSTAYVTNGFSGDVTPISTATNTAGPPIPTGGILPSGIAITPNGSTAYVANAVFGTVTPIDLSTNTAGTPIPVGSGSGPNAIAIAPDGSTAYVANASGTVTPIETSSNTAEPPITAGSGYAIAVTPDGSTAYVGGDNPSSPNLPGTVTPIDLSTKTVGTPILVGPGPAGIAITPDQAPIARLAVTPEPSGRATGFNASASTVAFGTIVSYSWTFGDGTTANTTTPATTHTYNAPGTYTATVTETDSAGTSTTQVFTGQTMSRNGGPSAEAGQQFTIPVPGPSVASVTPNKGPAFGFTLVRISGNNLTSGGAVLLLAQHLALWCEGLFRFEAGLRPVRLTHQSLGALAAGNRDGRRSSHSRWSDERNQPTGPVHLRVLPAVVGKCSDLWAVRRVDDPRVRRRFRLRGGQRWRDPSDTNGQRPARTGCRTPSGRANAPDRLTLSSEVSCGFSATMSKNPGLLLPRVQPADRADITHGEHHGASTSSHPLKVSANEGTHLKGPGMLGGGHGCSSDPPCATAGQRPTPSHLAPMAHRRLPNAPPAGQGLSGASSPVPNPHRGFQTPLNELPKYSVGDRDADTRAVSAVSSGIVGDAL